MVIQFSLSVNEILSSSGMHSADSLLLILHFIINICINFIFLHLGSVPMVYLV